MCRFCSLLLCLILCVGAGAQRLVLPGDHPDPSVVKIGDAYWASATSSNWAPALPLLTSTDLVNWKLVGHVFPKLPDWADYYFWAPEITYERGKVWVYYSAHKKGGYLCVGVASADRPEGPYTDHGPLVCQPVGSIDAFPIRDDSGKLFLVWKEDANSVNKPTPIWLQEMNESRTALVGEKRELFRNDQPWEGNLVEGVSMIRHGGWYYAFYAGAGCCGRGCTYTTGVARSKTLQGPWEKFSGNPLIKNEGAWTCPGHGTPVEKDDRHYFLYHAYDTAGGVYTGRQGLLREFRFTPDGWVEFLPSEQPGVAMRKEREDGFRGSVLKKEWEWSVFQQPQYAVRGGRLALNASPEGVALGQKTMSPSYTAQVEVRSSTAVAGLALLGDDKNRVAALVSGSELQVVRRRNGVDSVVARVAKPAGRKITLQLRVRNGDELSFFVKEKRRLQLLNPQPINGSYLPPWDRALRVGVVAQGANGQQAVFDEFEVEDK